MICREAQEFIEAYLDREIPEEEGVALEAHLSSCDRCAEDLRAARVLKARLATLSLAEPPAGFWERVRNRLDEATVPEPGVVGWRLRVRQLAPTLALLLIVVSVWVYHCARLGERGCLVAQLARLHHAAATRAPAAVPAPGTSSELGVLVEARTDRVQGKPVTQLVFQRGPQRISLFHIAAEDFDPYGLRPIYGAGQPVMAGQWGNVQVAAWRESNGVVIMTSEEPAPAMLHDARDMLIRVRHQMPTTPFGD